MSHYLALVLVEGDKSPSELLEPYGWPGDDCIRCLEAMQANDLATLGVLRQSIMDSDKPELGVAVETKQPLFEGCSIKGDPTPDCYGSRCARMPETKWDWWAVGGNYRGYLAELLSASDMTLDMNSKGDDNPLTIAVKDLPQPLPEEFTPHALLTPDGEWHEREEDSNEAKVTWTDNVRKLLAQNKDAEAVVCDLHI